MEFNYDDIDESEFERISLISYIRIMVKGLSVVDTITVLAIYGPGIIASHIIGEKWNVPLLTEFAAEASNTYFKMSFRQQLALMAKHRKHVRRVKGWSKKRTL